MDADALILAIDDHGSRLSALGAFLADRFPGLRLETAGTARQGLAAALAQRPDLILVRDDPAENDPGETCRTLRADPRLAPIPLMVVSDAPADRPRRLQALEAGADGYLCDAAELAAWIRVLLRARAGGTRAEGELALYRARLQALWDLSALADADAQTLSGHILASIIRMTGGQYGFYGVMAEDQAVMRIHAWSDQVMKDCAAVDRPRDFSLPEDGICAEALRRQEPFILDDYRQPHPAKKGLPEGHVQLTNLMVVPFGRRGRIDSVAAVANKPGGFNRDDATQVSVFLHGIQAILESRHIKAKLSESARRLEAFIDHSPLLITEITPEGRYLLVNQAAAQFYRRAPGELTGKTFDELLPARTSALFKQRLAQVVKTGSALLVEDRLDGSDGPQFYLTTLFPLCDETGQIRSVGGIAHDVTAFKQAAQSIQESQERIESIFRVAPTGIGVVRDRIFLEINTRLCEMTGYAAEELLGRSARIVYPSQAEFERVGREKYQQIAKFGTGAVETRFRRKDGTFLDVLLASTPLDTADPSKGITFTALDITERKQAEAALRLNEARLESLLRINLHPAENIQDLLDFALHEAIFLTGSKIGYIYFYDEDKKEFVLNTWSREVMRQCSVASPPGLYQLDKTGIWGEAVRQRRPIVVNDFAAPNPLKKGLPEGHAPLRTYLTIPVFCQERIVAVVGVANKESEYNDSDVRQLNLMMDAVWKIVQRKQAESERKSLQDQLLQAQKLESLGRLAGGVAHDFNNMLGVILGYAELTLQQMDANQPLSANLHEIRKAAERSAHLTRQLLAFARKQAVSPRVLDLNETVEGMLKMLRRLIGEDIDLTWMPGRNLWPVRVDPAQIDQILANLCVNARDAISGVGRITIETDAVRFDDAGRAGHPDLVAGHYVMLAVGDDGCGMDRQTLGNLFEPFFTTKEVGRGTGLGLATIYGIVKQNRGFIDVQSEPDQGTTFRIYLPRHDDAARADGQAKAGGRELTGSETVLLVEDEPSVLRMTTLMLQQLGYRVLAAAAPEEALRLAQSHPGEIQLLVTDVIMPEMNGKDLAAKLLPLYPRLKSLFMSGYTADVIAHHGVLSRGVHFIEKPFSRDSLAAKVRAALEKR